MKNKVEKQGFTKAAGIINIIYASFELIIVLIGLLFSNKVLSSLGVMSGDQMVDSMVKDVLTVIFIFCAIFDILIIVLASIMLKRTSKPVNEYKMGIPITLFVFNCVVALSSLINGMFWGTAIYAMCAVFIMIDVVKMKKLRDKSEIQEMSSTEVNSYSNYNDMKPQSYSQPPYAQQNAESNDLIKKIKKLDDMKATGVINEEEYAKMKELILKDGLK